MPTDLNSRKKSSLAAKQASVKAPPLPPASDDLKCVDVPICLHRALTLFVGSEEIVEDGDGSDNARADNKYLLPPIPASCPRG